MAVAPEVQHVRSLFLSDLHLGTRGCQADGVNRDAVASATPILPLARDRDAI